MRLLGAILAGGQSRRFGSDKALADFDGRPMITRVAAALSPFVEAIVVCGHPAPPAGLVGVADVPQGGLGPLAGLAGALRHAQQHGYDAVISVGCDTPLLDAELMVRLIEADGACFVSQAPIIGLWPTLALHTLLRHLDKANNRSMRAWTEVIGAFPIEAPSPIPNVNTPDDLERVLQSVAWNDFAIDMGTSIC